jgi:hypothetical protein
MSEDIIIEPVLTDTIVADEPPVVVPTDMPIVADEPPVFVPTDMPMTTDVPAVFPTDMPMTTEPTVVVPTDMPMSTEPPVVVPDVVSIDSLMNDQTMLVQREASTKTFLMDRLINVPSSSLKRSLLHWASNGFPAGFILLQLPLDVPEICSDGVSRTPSQYIEFCMGADAPQLYLALSSKLPGIMVSYAMIGTTLTAYVSKF